MVVRHLAPWRPYSYSHCEIIDDVGHETSALIGWSETISRLVPHPADALIGISLSSFIAGERSFAIL